MNERLKELRKNLSLNQKELGDKIKLSQTHISSLEKGVREITDRIISDICREFSVNDEWFRTGHGEMFTKKDATILAELASEYHLDAIDKMIIEHYLRLDAKDRQLIKERVVALAEDITALNETVATTEEIAPIGSDLEVGIEVDSEIEAELESYRRELEAQKKTRTSLVSRKHNQSS